MNTKITKNEMIGLISQRIANIEKDDDGWAEPERSVAIAELRMLIKRVQRFGVQEPHYKK